MMFSDRTRLLFKFDLLRWRARMKGRILGPFHKAGSEQLHIGCGGKRVKGWLNVDIIGSDFDIDLCAPLPWPANSFSCFVSQHVIEHLELEPELMPLLKEINRTGKKDAEVWLSCPDLEKVCRDYVDHKGEGLLKDRWQRFPEFKFTQGMPTSHFTNQLFHQWGEHKNLFDFDLLKWTMEQCGFHTIERTDESKFLQRFPDFPARNDNAQSIYIKALVKK